MSEAVSFRLVIPPPCSESQVPLTGVVPPPRVGSMGTYLPQSRQWLEFGGEDSTGLQLKDTWLYTFSTDTWEKIFDGATEIARVRGLRIPRGRPAGSCVASFDVLRPADWPGTLRLPSPPQNPQTYPSGRSWGTMVLVNSAAYMYGGSCSQDPEPARGTPCQDVLWEFNLLSRQWSNLVSPAQSQSTGRPHLDLLRPCCCARADLRLRVRASPCMPSPRPLPRRWLATKGRTPGPARAMRRGFGTTR